MRIVGKQLQIGMDYFIARMAWIHKILSKCKTSGKSGKKSERSETEDNTFLNVVKFHSKMSVEVNFHSKKGGISYQNYNFLSF